MAEKYLFIGELPDFHQIITLNNYNYLIGASSKDLLNYYIKNLNTNFEFLQDMPELFKYDFNYMVIRKETHIGGKLLFSRKNVFKYNGLSEDIYLNPKILESKLQTITSLFNSLGFKIDKN